MPDNLRLNFIKINPSGNLTLLVRDPLPLSWHRKIASKLMSFQYLACEQVGFIEKAGSDKAAARLQMMGGEFCGNAARALAALMVEQGHPQIKKDSNSPNKLAIALEVSGYSGLLNCKVCRTGEGSFWAESSVPVPRKVESCTLHLQGEKVRAWRVYMEGITHLVLFDVSPGEEVFRQARSWIDPYEKAEAAGVMFYQTTTSQLTPLVVVGKNYPPVWEGSCGSGSVAVAAAMAKENSNTFPELRLEQPQGIIYVDLFGSRGELDGASIKGGVEMVAEGTVTVLVHR